MMSHRRIRLSFDAYGRGTLAAAEAAEVQAHLQACPACANAWTQHQEVTSVLAALPMADPGLAFLDDVMAALPAAPARPLARWPEVVAVGGCLALAVVSAWLLVRTQVMPDSAGTWSVTMRQALAWWQAYQGETLVAVNDHLRRLPWATLLQALWATGFGLLVAFGIPVGERFAFARRRIR